LQAQGRLRGESIGRGRIKRELPPREEGHALRSDGGKVESQKARLRCLLFVFITPWAVRHVKAVTSDCVERSAVDNAHVTSCLVLSLSLWIVGPPDDFDLEVVGLGLGAAKAVGCRKGFLFTVAAAGAEVEDEDERSCVD
jgi:hypothetical protein